VKFPCASLAASASPPRMGSPQSTTRSHDRLRVQNKGARTASSRRTYRWRWLGPDALPGADGGAYVELTAQAEEDDQRKGVKPRNGVNRAMVSGAEVGIGS